jgi:uncharacterized protein
VTQQTHPLPVQFKALEAIQELDLKIERLQKSKGSLPESLRAMDQSLAKFQSGMAAKNNTLGEIEKVQRQNRAAQELNRDRLARSESRLTSVQNSHEYQAVNKEAEQLKKLTATLDEQFKKAESDTELLKKDLTELTAQYDKVKAERDSQAAVLAGQTQKLDTEITSLLTERSKHSSQVDKSTLSQYDRVRVARQGLGFVPAIAGRCKGCNMMVPPQLFNEIRKALVLHACPSCHRILFVPSDSPT